MPTDTAPRHRPREARGPHAWALAWALACASLLLPVAAPAQPRSRPPAPPPAARAAATPARAEGRIAARPLGADTDRAIERWLRAQMQLNHIPAVGVAVVRDGRVVLQRALGTANLEWRTPATVRTAFPLASATKPLTGMAVMRLVEEGRLALDSSVTHYLPEAPAAWRPVTVRHLLTHASGISDDLGPNAPGDAAEATRRVAARPLTFAPGSRSSYGIGGYAVAQHLVERVTGEPFPTTLHRHVLAPLGMTRTRFDHATNDGPFRAADVVPERAGVYRLEPPGGATPSGTGAQRIAWFHFGAEAYTAGGLLSTTEDLARWATALHGGALLGPAARRALWGDTASTGFGVGWVIGRYRGQRTVGHSGGPALADLLHLPDARLTVVVLANQSRLYPYLAHGVADLLLPAPRVAGTTATPPDTAPALTARLRAVLAAAAAGTVDTLAFTPDARREFVPAFAQFGLSYTRALGGPTAMTLVGERADGGRTEREYRVHHGRKPVRWRFSLTPDGRIAGLAPTPE